MKKLLFFFLVTFSLGVSAQEELPNTFDNPRDVIYNHLYFLQDDSFNDLQSAKSLARTGLARSVRAKLALQIKQILDGSGHYINIDALPDDPKYLDSLSNENKYVLTEEFPEIYVEKYGDVWLYSQETVQKVDAIHERMFPFGVSKLLRNLHPSEKNKFLGVYFWQYVFAAILIVGLLLLYRLVLFLLKKALLKAAARALKLDISRNVLHPLAAPISLLLTFSVLSRALPMLQLAPYIGQFIVGAIQAFLVLCLTSLLLRLTDVGEYYGVILARRSANSLDDHLVPLISKVIKGFIFVLGVVLMLNALGVDVLPLLTGLSIGGLAFALAAQDTIKNFFGSLMIFVDKPFQIGDWITEGDEIDGTVEEVGLRSTRIRTFRDSLLYVPNGEIANGRVDNHGARRYRRFYTTLNITYDTPARLIEVFIKGLHRIVLDHPDTRKDYYNVYLNDYEASSLRIMFYIFFEVPTWPEELRCRQEIMLEANKLAEHLGVRFAFPTQTLHVEQFPEKPSLTPKYTQTTDEFSAKMDAFFEAKDKK